MALVINTINRSGGGGTTITVVANYSALPDPTTVSGKFYWCENSQGTSWLPSSLGGTYYSAGQYYSNGTNWTFIDVPYQATLTEVNTGTNTDKFVTPSTLKNSTQWGTKVDSVNGQTGVVVLDTDALPEGATNLYFTNARALAAVPDASPTTKGKAKLYNILGPNTDGAIDQKTVTDELAKKQDIDSWKKEIITQDFFEGLSLNSSKYSLSTTGSGASVTSATPLTDTTKQGAGILKTGTTATGVAGLYLGAQNPPGSIKLGIGELTRETRIYIPTLSNATERFFIPFGYMSSANNVSVNGIFIMYDEGGKFLYGVVGSSPNFRCMTVNGTSRTVTDSLIAVTASTWYTLKVVINAAATEVKFYINGSLVATHTTDIYTAADMAGRIAIQKTDGTTNRQVELQYLRDTFKRTNPLP